MEFSNSPSENEPPMSQNNAPEYENPQEVETYDFGTALDMLRE